MGQKVNPNVIRLKMSCTWDSCWYSNRDYVKKLHEDIKIRKMIFNSLPNAGVSKVYIERPSNKIVVNIHSSKPGIVIGRKGADIVRIKKDIFKITLSEALVNITELKKPETNPLLIAANEFQNKSITTIFLQP